MGFQQARAMEPRSTTIAQGDRRWRESERGSRGALGGLAWFRGPSDGEEPVGKSVGEAVESAASDRDGLQVRPQAVPDLGFRKSP